MKTGRASSAHSFGIARLISRKNSATLAAGSRVEILILRMVTLTQLPFL